MTVFVLLTHLAGALCCGTPLTPFATEAECRAAGEAWLQRVKYRNPNDHYECVERRI